MPVFAPCMCVLGRGKPLWQRQLEFNAFGRSDRIQQRNVPGDE